MLGLSNFSLVPRPGIQLVHSILAHSRTRDSSTTHVSVNSSNLSSFPGLPIFPAHTTGQQGCHLSHGNKTFSLYFCFHFHLLSLFIEYCVLSSPKTRRQGTSFGYIWMCLVPLSFAVAKASCSSPGLIIAPPPTHLSSFSLWSLSLSSFSSCSRLCLSRYSLSLMTRSRSLNTRSCSASCLSFSSRSLREGGRQRRREEGGKEEGREEKDN